MNNRNLSGKSLNNGNETTFLKSQKKREKIFWAEEKGKLSIPKFVGC